MVAYMQMSGKTSLFQHRRIESPYSDDYGSMLGEQTGIDVNQDELFIDDQADMITMEAGLKPGVAVGKIMVMSRISWLKRF